MKGKLRTTPIRAEEQYIAVDDVKLRMTIAALSDKYSEKIRTLIYRTYQDDHLALIYRRIRNSGIYDRGSKDKVRKKILQFPSGYVYDFCDTVMTTLYGPDWLSDRRALRHELVAPWLVVNLNKI